MNTVPSDWRQASYLYDRAPDAMRRALMATLFWLSPPGKGDLLMGHPWQVFEQAARRMGLNEGPAPKLTLEDYVVLDPNSTPEFGPQVSADVVGRPDRGTMANPELPSVPWRNQKGESSEALRTFLRGWWAMATEHSKSPSDPIVRLVSAAPVGLPEPMPKPELQLDPLPSVEIRVPTQSHQGRAT